MERIWYWAMPALGVLVGGFAVYAVVALFVSNGFPDSWGLQAGITFLFFFPGLLLSLGLSQIILSRRKPRAVFTAERVLIGILVGLTVILTVTSLDVEAFVGIYIGPIIMIIAIALTITIAVNSARESRPVVVPAIWTQPAPPDAEPTPEAEPSSPYGPVGS